MMSVSGHDMIPSTGSDLFANHAPWSPLETVRHVLGPIPRPWLYSPLVLVLVHLRMYRIRFKGPV